MIDTQSSIRHHLTHLQTSLRIKIALGVALPVMLALIALSLTHYWRERKLLELQTQLTMLQLSEMIKHSMRHAMLNHDLEMMSRTLADIDTMDNIHRIQILDLDGYVKVDSQAATDDTVRHTIDPGCHECHRFSPGARPYTIHLATSPTMRRIFTAIDKEPACSPCHAVPTGAHLGILLVDLSLIDIENHLLGDLRMELAISLGITLLMTVMVYGLIHGLVVRRVEGIHRSLDQFASRDFSPLPAPLSLADELDGLAHAFTAMTDQLKRYILEQKERHALQQQAVSEERERIARELHDETLQTLASLVIGLDTITETLDRDPALTRSHIARPRKTVDSTMDEVRSIVRALRPSLLEDLGLLLALKAHAQDRLEPLGVNWCFEADRSTTQLPPQLEATLFRVVQEAINNIARHAHASHACIALSYQPDRVLVDIWDDGVGFDASQKLAFPQVDKTSLGLLGMQERLASIGGQLQVHTSPGQGTRLLMVLPLLSTPEAIS